MLRRASRASPGESFFSKRLLTKSLISSASPACAHPAGILLSLPNKRPRLHFSVSPHTCVRNLLAHSRDFRRQRRLLLAASCFAEHFRASHLLARSRTPEGKPAPSCDSLFAGLIAAVMFRCWSPVYFEEENHLPYDDFDPLKEWLVHPDDVQLQNPSDLSNTSLDSHELLYSGVKREQKDLILESSIDVKMEKVSLGEIADRGQGEVGLEEIGGGSDGDNTCVKPGLEDFKSNLPNQEGISEGKSDEEGTVEAQSDNRNLSSYESSSDESMCVAKSLSSSEDEDEDDVGMERREEAEEFEEGEVREFYAHGVDFLSDEEGQGPKGPIRSKHEVENLPPVPMVEVTLQPNHQLLPVGVISSIMSNRVIVEGSVLHNPLNEGSTLWITDTRLPLGLVDEIFGPVKNPYYVVRYNTEEEVPAGIGVGIDISFVAEFATQILNDKELYKKGYDASGDNDEEVDNEVEFSDDEKEVEYKKSLREGKRAINHCKGVRQEARFERKRNTFKGPGTQHRDIQKQPNCAQISIDQAHTTRPLPPRPPPLCGQSCIGPQSWSSSTAPANADSMPPAMTPQFPQAIQANNFPCNPATAWPPGFSPQLQNTGLQGDLPMQLQNQNVILNNLVNMMAFQHLLHQFVPHQGSTFPWGGAAPSMQPLGQNNIVPSPFSNGFINVPGMVGPGNEQIRGQAPLPAAPSMQFNVGSNEQIRGQAPLLVAPSMQFNVGSSASSHFNGGNSSSRGRRPYQRGGGGRFFDRGGRRPNI